MNDEAHDTLKQTIKIDHAIIYNCAQLCPKLFTEQISYTKNKRTQHQQWKRQRESKRNGDKRQEIK